MELFGIQDNLMTWALLVDCRAVVAEYIAFLTEYREIFM